MTFLHNFVGDQVRVLLGRRGFCSDAVPDGLPRILRFHPDIFPPFVVLKGFRCAGCCCWFETEKHLPPAHNVRVYSLLDTFGGDLSVTRTLFW